MRVAIYGRVSTGHQVEHQTIEQQLERLAGHVRAHAAEGWALDPAHVFRDDGHSGAALARPGLDRLRDAVKGREVDRVLVTAPDRLARNYVHQMVLLEEWVRAGCTAEFLDRPMSDDPHDRLLLQIRGAVAEYERTLIAERMRRGRLAKLRAGELLPWTYAPYGYRLGPDRPRDPRGVTVDPAEAAVVAELFAMYREPGASLMRLAMHLDRRGIPTPTGTPRWSSPTVRGILRNPTYTGQVYAQRTRYRAPTHRRSATHPIGHPHGTAVPQPADTWLLVGQVPAVVSQAQFDEVQAKLAANRSFARRNNTAHQYLLRALVSCGRCGLACTARAVNGRNFYYLCGGKGHSTFSHRATCCAARYTPAGQLDELVWTDLCALLGEPAPLATAVARAHGGAWLPQELLARRDTLRRAQAHLHQQIERLTDAYLRAVLPLDEYERRRRDLEGRAQALAGQEELLCNDAERRQQLAGVGASLEAFRGRVQHGLATATFEQRRQLVLLLIDRVVVTDAEVEIRYVLPTSPESEHVRFCHLRKDYFHHPAPRDHLEAARLLLQPVAPQVPVAVLGHLDAPAALRLEPAREGARVGAVAPDQLKARQFTGRGAADERLRPEPVVQVGGVDVREQDEAGGVHQHVPLATGHALGRVVAARRAADAGRPRRLAVDDGRCRLAVAPFGLARQRAQPVVHAPQRAVEPPAPEMRGHGGPGREAAGQQAPSAARPDEVGDRLGHEASRPLERAPSTRRRRGQRLQRRPLRVGQVGRVAAGAGFAHRALGKES